MSKAITQSLESGILHTFGLVNEFIKQCPDAVWEQPYGKWPVWQQLYHAFTAVDFFLRPKDAPAVPTPVPGPVGNLAEVAVDVPSKQLIHDFIAKTQAEALDYIAGLDDATLAVNNEGLSARIGRDMTHAATLGLLAAHTMYHLGCCDAALRQNGLPGVF